MKESLTLEVCCNSLNSAVAAYRGGANRIELCDNLLEGGTTPSLSSIRIIRDLVNIPIHVLIRPRGGDFLYDPVEMRQILLDIQCCRELQIDGIVVGMLDESGNLDKDNFHRVVSAAGEDMSITFHRAIDMSKDPYSLLNELKLYKTVDRVLTCGLSMDLKTRVENLSRMREIVGDDIKVMVGGGVNQTNVEEVIKKARISEIHFSGKGYRKSNMMFQNKNIAMGGNDPELEFSILETKKENVEKMKNILDKIER
ncbi:MAG: copper homeostasis protein CutC [Bacteroidales bacterium]